MCLDILLVDVEFQKYVRYRSVLGLFFEKILVYIKSVSWFWWSKSIIGSTAMEEYTLLSNASKSGHSVNHFQ